MKRLLFLVLYISSCSISQGQIDTNKIIGEYRSTLNRFERWSIMIIKEKNRFEYSYLLGGCQAVVTGNWSIKDSFLNFKNDSEFLINPNDSTLIGQASDTLSFYIHNPYYPDLSKINWRIGKNWIRPSKKIETGCFFEKGKHKKIKINAL